MISSPLITLIICIHTYLIRIHFNFRQFSYSLMLRIYKTYEIHYQNPDVSAKTVSFSSRPGDLESKDDFYVTDSGLVVMETSFNTYNTSNYGYLHYDSVPVWIRVQTATRLAKNSSHWATIFESHRSGTHNSQWVVVDMNKYAAQKNLPKSQMSDIGNHLNIAWWLIIADSLDV